MRADGKKKCKSLVGARKCKSPAGKKIGKSPVSRTMDKRDIEFSDFTVTENLVSACKSGIGHSTSTEENSYVLMDHKSLMDDLTLKGKEEKSLKGKRASVSGQIKNDENKKRPDNMTEKPEKQKLSSNDRNKINLNDMEKMLLEKVTIIQYEKNLYYYSGRTYKIIINSDDLLRIIRLKVSNSGFNCNSLKWVRDLFDFMMADDNLIPEDCMEKLSIASLYVVFRNGVLDLRTLKLMRHSKEYLTFYELDAEWTKSIRPKVFEKFVGDISNGDTSIEIRILEVMGYLLSPYNQGKKFFVMGTAHDSGKSTIGELLEQLIGSENVAHLSTHQLGNRFSLGNIHGKILNLAMDLPKGKLDRVTVSIIKMASGGDKIATEQKYERMKEIHSNMRFLFASNYPVTISREDDDDAFWERMIPIPFYHSIDETKRDRHLIENMLVEKEGIFYVCFMAFHKILKQNGIFSPCIAADKMKNQWRYGGCNDSSYIVQRFIEDCVDVTGEKVDDIYSKDLYEQYRDYCIENRFPVMSYSKMINWCDENLSGCEKCRIHHEAKENPKSGFKGMKWK